MSNFTFFDFRKKYQFMPIPNKHKFGMNDLLCIEWSWGGKWDENESVMIKTADIFAAAEGGKL